MVSSTETSISLARTKGWMKENGSLEPYGGKHISIIRDRYLAEFIIQSQIQLPLV